MKDDSIDLSEHGLALLALQLPEQDSANVAEACTDDQLTALYAGRLADTERARVLNAIAQDRNTYGRWLRLVEVNHAVDSYDASSVGAEQAAGNDRPRKPATKSPPVTRKPAVWPTLQEKCLRWSRPLAYATGALATAVFAFILIYPRTPDYQAQLDQLYRDYGQESRQLLQAPDTLPSRSAGPAANAEQDQIYSPAQTALAKGIAAGLQAFASNASIPDLTIDEQKYNSHQNQLPPADQAALMSLGRLVVLTYPRCQHTRQTDFYQQVGPLYLHLSQQLRPANYTELKTIEPGQLPQAASDKSLSQQEICMISVTLINQFKGT